MFSNVVCVAFFCWKVLVVTHWWIGLAGTTGDPATVFFFSLLVLLPCIYWGLLPMWQTASLFWFHLGIAGDLSDCVPVLWSTGFFKPAAHDLVSF